MPELPREARETLPAPVDLDDLLEPFSRRGVDLGLSRLREALREGGHPERRFPALQVAGTNGKGSICRFLHEILRAAGWRSLLYSSPHLISWCERIRINDRWIDPSLLRSDLSRWQEIGRRHGLTPFEFLTAAAFDRCAREEIDMAVLEVGLGGRLDATTVHPDRRVVGFGAIGRDHREHLGGTLEAIAFEKAGALAPGGLAVSGPQPPQAEEVLRARARELGCELQWVAPLPSPAEGGPVLGLGGELQRANAAVAAAMATVLSEHRRPSGLPPLDRAVILRGLSAARWPGRLERRRWHGRELLIDGAHNPPAAAALRQEIDRLDPQDGPHPRGRRWLVGIQRHKEGAAMLRHLLRPGDQAAIVPIPHHASWTAAELSEVLPSQEFRLIDLADLLDGLQWMAVEGPLPVVTGSLHLIGGILPQLDP